MKEKYFTAETIEEESQALIEEVKYYSGSRKFRIDVRHMALLVIDMQNYFLDPNEHAFIPSAPSIFPNVKRIMQVCKELGVPTILTRHVNSRDNAGLMGIRWHEVIRDGDPRSDIHPDIISIGGEVLVKSQFDAFHGTKLEKRLKAAGVRQIVLTGVMTNLCCETTARSAFVKGFEVIMPVDATAAYNYEFHLATFLNMAYIFSRPITSRELISAMNETT